MAVGHRDMVEVEVVSLDMVVAMGGMEGMRRLVCFFFRSLYIAELSWPNYSFLFSPDFFIR